MKTRGKEEKLVGRDSPQLINNPTGPISGPLPATGPGDWGAMESFRLLI